MLLRYSHTHARTYLIVVIHLHLLKYPPEALKNRVIVNLVCPKTCFVFISNIKYLVHYTKHIFLITSTVVKVYYIILFMIKI